MKVFKIFTLICINFTLLITLFGQEKDRTVKIYKWQNEPIKILSIKIKNKEIKTDEKFTNYDDDWFSGLTVEVENTSNQTIVNIQIALDFAREAEMTKSPARDLLWYGSSDLSVVNKSQPPLKRGEKAKLKIENYQEMRNFLDKAGHSKSLKEFRISLGEILFADGTKWYAGKIFKRDPNNHNRWLPEKNWTSYKNGLLDSNLFKATNFRLSSFLAEPVIQSSCYEIFYQDYINCRAGCSASNDIKGAEDSSK